MVGFGGVVMRRARRGCTHAQGSRGFDLQSVFAMRKRPRPRPRLDGVVLVALTRWKWFGSMNSGDVAE